MKILIVRLSSLGDIVYLSPLTSALSKKNEVHLATYKKFFSVAELLPGVRKIWAIEHPLNIFEACKFAKIHFRHEKYDIVADLHKKLNTLALTICSKPRKRLFYNKRSFKRRLYVKFKWPGLKKIHISEQYAEPFRKIGVLKEKLPDVRLNPVAGPEGKLKDLPKDYIVIAPEASHRPKEWPYFEKLGKFLIKEKLNVVLVGLRKDFTIHGAIDLRGKTTLKELILVLNSAKLVVSNDSGPGHLACALGTKTILIYGPTSTIFGYEPMGAHCRVLEKDLPCRPCSLHGEKACDARPCLSSLTVEEVLKEVKGFL